MKENFNYQKENSNKEIINYYGSLKEKIKKFTFLEYKKMIKSDLLSDSEDINLGVYKEMIEPQCRMAVININKKGWKTFESGFLGEKQYIGFCDESMEDLEKNEDFINSQLQIIKNRYGINSLFIKKSENRFQIIIDCSNIKFKINELKTIFDDIAEMMPNLGSTNNSISIRYGTQFLDFMADQFIYRIFDKNIFNRIEKDFSNTRFLELIKEIKKEEKTWKKENIFLNKILGLIRCDDENNSNFGQYLNIEDIRKIFGLYDFSFLSHKHNLSEEEMDNERNIIYKQIKNIGAIYNKKAEM